MRLNTGLSLKIKEKCVFWSFFKIDICSATSFKRSRRELSIDMAEHRFILENNQYTHYPRFSFIPKTGVAFSNTEVCFYCDFYMFLDLRLVLLRRVVEIQQTFAM